MKEIVIEINLFDKSTGDVIAKKVSSGFESAYEDLGKIERFWQTSMQLKQKKNKQATTVFTKIKSEPEWEGEMEIKNDKCPIPMSDDPEGQIGGKCGGKIIWAGKKGECQSCMQVFWEVD